MNTRAPTADEVRADLIQLMWAYIETTKSGVLEWPAPSVDSQSTPVTAADETALLFELAGVELQLRYLLQLGPEKVGGQPS